MPGHSYRDPYEKLFLKLCKRVEKLLLRSIAGALALLIISQVLLQIPWMRSWLNRVDRLEGVPYRHDEHTVLPAETTMSSASERN